MQKFRKIFWRVGQEMTPETFMQADNYAGYQQSLIHSLMNPQSYGLLPASDDSGSTFNMKADLEGATVYIEQIRCLGTTKNGYLIDCDNALQSPTLSKSISVAGLAPDYHYLVIQVNPYEQQLIQPVENEETPFSMPACRFSFKSLSQIAGDELPVLKINGKREQPEIVKNYIPPSMCLHSHPALLAYQQKFIQAVSEILSFLHAKEHQYRSSIYPVSMLLYELETLSPSEPPHAIVRLLKRLLKTFILLVREVPPSVEKTLETPYNHNDTEDMLRQLMTCLQEVKDFIASEEEDFTPKI